MLRALPRSAVTFATLAAVTITMACVAVAAAPHTAHAQSSWRQHADRSRLRESIDSFTVVAGERALGWQRLGAIREGEGWMLSDEVALGGIAQKSEARFSPPLIEVSLRQQGRMGATDMRIVLDRKRGRFAGTALTPSGGPTAQPIDVEATDDLVDDNAMTMILPMIAWRDSLSFTLPVVSSGKGTVEAYAVRTLGRRQVTVPAGTFATWHVTLSGARYAVEADITIEAPYHLVRFGPRGAPMSSQLVSSRPNY